jgi:hypothetical protein
LVQSIHRGFSPSLYSKTLTHSLARCLLFNNRFARIDWNLLRKEQW